MSRAGYYRDSKLRPCAYAMCKHDTRLLNSLLCGAIGSLLSLLHVQQFLGSLHGVEDVTDGSGGSRESPSECVGNHSESAANAV